MGKQLQNIELNNGEFRQKNRMIKVPKKIKKARYDLVNTHHENCTGEDRENITDDERYGLGESSDYSKY